MFEGELFYREGGRWGNGDKHNPQKNYRWIIIHKDIQGCKKTTGGQTIYTWSSWVVCSLLPSLALNLPNLCLVCFDSISNDFVPLIDHPIRGLVLPYFLPKPEFIHFISIAAHLTSSFSTNILSTSLISIPLIHLNLNLNLAVYVTPVN